MTQHRFRQCAMVAGRRLKERPERLPADALNSLSVLVDGFGAEGRGSEVPPNATLEIDMALLGWKKVEKVTSECRWSLAKQCFLQACRKQCKNARPSLLARVGCLWPPLLQAPPTPRR